MLIKKSNEDRNFIKPFFLFDMLKSMKTTKGSAFVVFLEHFYCPNIELVTCCLSDAKYIPVVK